MLHVSTGPTYAVFDVETSGLSSRWHRILQIGVVVVDAEGTVIREWSSYVKPFLGHVGATHIHGLTRQGLRDAPSFKAIASELVATLNGSTIVAHNIGFDWAFLRRALRRAGYRPPDPVRMCTLQMSRRLDPERQLRHRLIDVSGRYDVELTHAHDALSDARATAGVLPRLIAATGGNAVTGFTEGSDLLWPTTPKRWWRRYV